MSNKLQSICLHGLHTGVLLDNCEQIKALKGTIFTIYNIDTEDNSWVDTLVHIIASHWLPEKPISLSLATKETDSHLIG